MTHCTQLPLQRKAVTAKCRTWSAVGHSLMVSVSKSKLVYSNLIFVYNKLTLICLLTWQRLVAVSVRNTQVIQLIWRDQRLWGQKCNANGAHETITILPVTSSNVHQFKNSFTRKLSDKIKCVVSKSSFLKCLAMGLLPCDLSLITIHISYWRHFSDIYISQGSVKAWWNI